MSIRKNYTEGKRPFIGQGTWTASLTKWRITERFENVSMAMCFIKKLSTYLLQQRTQNEADSILCIYIFGK